MELKNPFRISHTVVTHLEHLLLKMTANNLVSYGECIPIPFLGETVFRAEKEINYIIDKYKTELYSVINVESLREFIITLGGGFQKCTIFAIEMLFLDYLAKLKSINIADLLGISFRNIITSTYTLPIQETYSSDVLAKYTENYSFLKVKLGSENDIAILRDISLDESGCKYILDVNQGWSRKQLEENLQWISAKNILLLEDPIKITSVDDVKYLQSLNIPTDIFLDEPITSIGKAINFANCVDGINLKFVRVGGVFALLDIVNYLKQLKKKVMLGCYIESSLSIAFASQFSTLFNYVDLDGFTFIENDQFCGLSFDKGNLNLQKASGIGVQHV